MPRKKTNASGQQKISGGDDDFHIADYKVEPLIEAYDDAIRLLQMKRPETDARSAFVLSSCANANAGQALEPCVSELGECPTNDAFDMKYGGIYAYNNDPKTKEKHPIARCVPVGTGIQKKDAKIVGLHQELMQLLLVLKNDVGPQLERLMDFHSMIRDCETHRTKDGCQFPTATGEDGEVVRKCIWKGASDGEEATCMPSQVYAVTLEQTNESRIKQLSADLRVVKDELHNNPTFARFHDGHGAPYDRIGKLQWRQWRHLKDKKSSLESQLRFASHKRQMMHRYNSDLRKISREQMAKKSICDTHLTYGGCASDNKCVVVEEKNGDEGGRMSDDDARKKGEDATLAGVGRCLPEDGDIKGTWFYDKSSGKIGITNPNALGSAMFDDPILKEKAAGGNWFTKMIYGVPEHTQQANLQVMLEGMLGDTRQGARPLTVQAKLRFIQSMLELIQEQLNTYGVKDDPVYNAMTSAWTAGLLTFAQNAECDKDACPKDVDKENCETVHGLLRKYKNFADEHYSLHKAHYSADKTSMIDAMIEDAKGSNVANSLKYGKDEEINKGAWRAFLVGCAMFHFASGEQARWFFANDDASRTLEIKEALGRSSEARYGYVTVYMASAENNGQQQFTFADKHLNKEGAKYSLNPKRCLKNYVGAPDSATGIDKTMPHILMKGEQNAVVDSNLNAANYPTELRIQPGLSSMDIQSWGDKTNAKATGQGVDADNLFKASERLRWHNDGIVQAANMDIDSIANMSQELDLRADQLLGHTSIDGSGRLRRRGQKRTKGWFNRNNYSSVRGGDDVQSVATASDNASALSGGGGDDVSLMSTEFPGQPPRMDASVLSGGGGDDVSLMSTEFSGQPPRFLSGGADETLSLLSTEFPGQPPRMAALSEEEVLSELSELSEEEVLSELSELSEEEVLSELSELSAGSTSVSPSESPMMVPDTATQSLDVDRVYEEFYAAGDLQSTASSVSHLY
jgi:hypothetical protein